MFLEYLTELERFDETVARLRRGTALYAPRFYAPYVLAGVIERSDATGWLVVAEDGEAAAKLAGELAAYLDREVATLPARGVMYGADVAPAAHVVGERQRALTMLKTAADQGGVGGATGG